MGPKKNRRTPDEPWKQEPPTPTPTPAPASWQKPRGMPKRGVAKTVEDAVTEPEQKLGEPLQPSQPCPPSPSAFASEPAPTSTRVMSTRSAAGGSSNNKKARAEAVVAVPVANREVTETVKIMRKAFSVSDAHVFAYIDEHALTEYVPLDATAFPDDKTAPSVERLLNMWNSWTFKLRNTVLYGNTHVNGVAFPTFPQIYALKKINDFIGRHFALLPPVESSLLQPADQEAEMIAASGHLTVADVKTYIDSNYFDTDEVGSREDCTDAVLLIVLMANGMDYSVTWTAFRGRVGMLPVKARFIENPRVFIHTKSSHPECTDVSDAWITKLCAVAHTVCGVKAGWACQFYGMHAYMDAAYEYYEAMRRGGVASGDDVSAVHLVKQLGIKPTPIIITMEASFSEIRLPADKHFFEFEWMFVSAFILTKSSAGRRLEFIKGMKDGERPWAEVMLPKHTFAHVHGRAREEDDNSDLQWLQGCSEKGKAALDLRWPLSQSREGGKHHVAGKCAVYDGVEFGMCAYAPTEQTAFTSRVTRLEPQSVLETMDRELKPGTPNDDRLENAFAAASVLMHMGVNDVFTFEDCKARRALKEVLVKCMPHSYVLACTSAMDASFLTHASTSLWSWLFKRVSEDRVSLRTCMAYACEAAATHPEFEQLALYSAYVRIVKLPSPGAGRSAGAAEKRKTTTDDKCVLFSGLSDCDEPIFDEADDSTIGRMSLEYADMEVWTTAAACILSPHLYHRFRSFSNAIQSKAIVYHLLMRGDWENLACSEAFRAALHGGASKTTTASEAAPSSVLPEAEALVCEGVAVFVDADDAMTEVAKKVVDSTCTSSVAETNAKLFTVHPCTIVETIIHAFANRVRFGCTTP